MRPKKEINYELKNNRGNLKYCSLACINYNSVQGSCLNCGKEMIIKKSNLNKNNFCSRSCAATHNNKNKTKGTRRSKLEQWIESQLNVLYPNLLIDYNKKDAIGSELDIYIPSLNLAFELNGIFHYEPIYGSDKLNRIQENDNNKFQLCQQKNISLCIIDTSSQKYFKEKSSITFLNLIRNIIDDNR